MSLLYHYYRVGGLPNLYHCEIPTPIMVSESMKHSARSLRQGKQVASLTLGRNRPFFMRFAVLRCFESPEPELQRLIQNRVLDILVAPKMDGHLLKHDIYLISSPQHDVP